MQCSRTVETWTVSRALRRLFDEDYDQQKREPGRNEWRVTEMLTETGPTNGRGGKLDESTRSRGCDGQSDVERAP